MNLEQRSTSFDTGHVPESVAAGSWASAAAQDPKRVLEGSGLTPGPESERGSLMPDHDHEFQWHPMSEDFGVCSICGHEATPEEAERG